VLFPIPIVVLRDDHFLACAETVMLTVIGKMAYVRDFLLGMTVMTLMTVLYGLILNRGCISTS
jgi:hypothetical protein